MAFATLDQKTLSRCTLRVPWRGAWVATVELEEPATLGAGQLELQIGSTILRGTVDPARSGVFAGSHRVTVVAGAGAWGRSVARRGYHNDGRLQRSQMLRDVASEIGEVAIVDSSVDGTLEGVDFIREAGPASRVLDVLFPGVAWYVGADGVTRVGPRPTVDASSSVQVLTFARDSRTAEIAFEGDDVSAAFPGATIADAERLGADTLTIHDCTIHVNPKKCRAFVRSGTDTHDRIVGLVQAIARASDPQRAFWGLYRYRVFRMSGDRVELQAVRADIGLPDAIPIPIAPGLGGASASLTPGSVVYVAFADGDPSLPVVVAGTPRGEPGHVPVLVRLDATTDVELGGAGGRVLRSGDKVSISGLLDGDSAPVTSPSTLVTIALDPVVNLAPGAPGVGYSKVKA